VAVVSSPASSPHSGSDAGSDGGTSSNLPVIDVRRPSTGILLVLRRMRTPIIVLILIFAVSTVGLTLMPGEDAEGNPHRLSIFEAFYFITYTASTIGFGELPYPFTASQRLWVTVSIFMAVTGWAYAIGSLLSLMQDRAFRAALARRHFVNKVRHLGEPFLVLVGYGNAARSLARSLDEMGRRFVVVDQDEERIAGVELDAYRADSPALLGNARDTEVMALAGAAHPRCEGVVALTGNDDTNLDVAMTVGLLRPGLPVIARTSSRDIAERMELFGAWQVVNPLDRFGDHVRILLRSPAAYQLMVWLTSSPGSPLPPRRKPLPSGRWVVSGDGRFGRELTEDLRAEDVEVTLVRGGHPDSTSDSVQAGELDAEHLQDAVAFVAATESDMTNLWLLRTAQQMNPDLFLVSLQNRASNARLYESAGVDFGMLPAELIVHEVLARLANPELMEFLPKVPHMGEEWSDAMIDRLVDVCGEGAPDLWRIELGGGDAPGLQRWLADGRLTLGDLLRDPHDREQALHIVPLVHVRDGDGTISPEPDLALETGDVLLLAAGAAARRILSDTLWHPSTAAYVIDDRVVPSSWVWRKLTRTSG
jgi:voltage-gated potassium channel